MKQLLLYGSTGDNVCIVKLPTNWTLEETKDLLEKVLIEFQATKSQKEFFTILNEAELNRKYPKKVSEVVECCKIILADIGSPISGAGGLIWQIRLQSYIMTHPAFTERLFKAFSNPLTQEEEAYLSSMYLDIVPTVVKTIQNSL